MNLKMYEIADFYGINTQLMQLIEESGEIIQAISKFFRVRGYGHKLSKETNGEAIYDNLVEEMADVKLLIDQCAYLLGCNTKMNEVINFKIERTIKRMYEN